MTQAKAAAAPAPDMTAFAALLASAITARASGLNPLPDTPDRGKTEAHSHVATARGYAAGIVVEPGEFVPADVHVALEEDHPEGWMREATKKDLKALEAAEEA